MSALQTSKQFSPKSKVMWILTQERSKMDGLVMSAGMPFIVLWIIVFIITLQGWGSFRACIILPGWHLDLLHSYCLVIYSMLYSLTCNWCIYLGTPRPTSQSINAAVSKVLSCMTMPFPLAMKNLVSSNPTSFLACLYLIIALNFRQKTLDGALVSRVPTFTKLGLTDYIIEFIVSEDEVCHLHLLCWSLRADLFAGFSAGGQTILPSPSSVLVA